MDRSKQIIQTSIKAILVNLFLVVSKAIVGILSGSIAIVLDALNNFSDALSSIVIIIGTKIARKPRDHAHPFGFGRIEYLSSLILALLILFSGYQSVVESIDKILHPGTPDYSVATFIVLGLAVLVKYFFGKYLSRKGKELNALSLSAAGSDARMDAAISLSTIVAAVIFLLFHFNIDGWLGVAISVLIIKTGLDILKEGTSSLLGNRTDFKLTEDIKKRISQVPDVLGAYDLILHDYGPDMMIGSVHIEVRDSLNARQIDQISRNITALIIQEFSVLLTVGIYASNCSKDEDFMLEEKIRQYVLKQPDILQIHGYYLDEEQKLITFDAVYGSGLQHPQQLARKLESELEKQFPSYHFRIAMDYDYSLSE